MKIKVVTPEEHKEWCKQQIKEHGLYNAVKDQLDEWVSICHPLGYMGFGEATERAMNVLDLIEAFTEENNLRRETVSASDNGTAIGTVNGSLTIVRGGR